MKSISEEEFKNRYGSSTVTNFKRMNNERLNTTPKKQGGFLETVKDVVTDIPQDISQISTDVSDAFAGGRETANEAREQVTAGEISPIAGTAKTIGGGLKAGAESVGAGVMSLLRLPFTQKAETAIGEKVSEAGEAIADTDIVQSAVAKYEELEPEQKAIVDGFLGTTEGLATIVGAGPAVKAAKTAVQTPASVIGRGYTKIADATSELEGINLPSIEGINLAKKAGIAPEDLMQRVARVSKSKQAKFEERAGESIGEYLVNREVFGTPDQIVDQLYERMKESKGRVDQSLSTVQGDFKAPQVKTALDMLIERDVNVSSPGAVAPESARITELYKKYNQQGLNLSEVNEVKRLFERNVRVDYLRDNVSGNIERANRIDSSLRNLVEDKASKSGVSTVRELNKETSLAKQLLDDIGAEVAGSAGNNAIGLTDSLFLAEALGSANPMAAAGFLTKKGLSSKKVMSEIAKRTSPNAGSKTALPEVPEQDKLTGYLKFLEQTSQTDQ